MTDNKTTLRQTENDIVIEGLAYDVRIEEKDINGKKAMVGEIDIEVAENEVHTVNVFAYKINSKGQESGLYKAYKTIADEYKTVKGLNGDRVNADKVRAEQCAVGKNEYHAQDGNLKSYPRISATFVNRLRATDTYKPRADFKLEMFVTGTKDETNKEGEETGRLILKGLVLGYQGGQDDSKKIFPFDVIIENEKAVNYVRDNYEKNTTVTVRGKIVNTVTVTEEIIEAAFGENEVKQVRRTVREYIVNAGEDALAYDPDEDNKALNPKEIKEALAARESALDAKKDNGGSNSNKTGGATTSKRGGGFGNDDNDPFKDDGKPSAFDDSEELPF